MRGALECGVSGRVRHAKNLNIIISQSVAIGKKIFHNWLRLHAACWIEMYMYVNAMFTYNAEEFCKEHMDHLMLFFACSIHLVCTFKVPVSFYCNPWHMTLTQRVPKVILYPLCHRFCQISLFWASQWHRKNDSSGLIDKIRDTEGIVLP